MTTPEHNYDHRFLVVRAVHILAAALGPVVADMVTAKGFERYRAGDGGERPLSTLAATSDASEVVGAMRDYWREVFQPHFGHRGHWQVRQMVCNVRSIRNYYVGGHDHVKCDYEPYEALGEIARLLRRFSAADAARQVDELKRELGGLMYGQPSATTPSAGGDNFILDKEALSMLLADAVSQEVTQQLRSELGRADLRLPEGIAPPTPGMVRTLPLPTVPLVGASSDVDAAPVSAENVRLANDAFNRGNAHVRQGDYDQAVAEYTVAIELDPQDACAYYIIRGCTYDEKGDYHHAIADFNTAMELDPQDACAYHYRGISYAKLGEYDQAIADYTDSIRLDPYHSDTYYDRGIAYEKLGKYEWAIADYTAAIRLSPQFAGAYHNRGLAYLRQGDYGQAIADCTELIGLSPQFAGAYYNRGLACLEQGEYGLAIADYTEVIELNPQDAGAYHNRGLAYLRLGEYDQAIADCTEAIGLNPQDAGTYNIRGLAYAGQGNLAYQEQWHLVAHAGQEDYDKAIADYTTAIALNPQDADAYKNRGVAYCWRRDYDKAIADYTTAIALNPQDADAYKNRGVAYRGQKDYDKAIADHTTAIALNPQGADAYINRGLTYVLQEEYERAIEDVDEAIAIAPDTDAYSKMRDLIIRLRGDSGDSADYDQAIADAPDDPENWHLRGLYYSEREEYGRAVDDYTKALELVTGDGNAAEIYSDRGLAWARAGG